MQRRGTNVVVGDDRQKLGAKELSLTSVVSRNRKQITAVLASLTVFAVLLSKPSAPSASSVDCAACWIHIDNDQADIDYYLSAKAYLLLERQLLITAAHIASWAWLVHAAAHHDCVVVICLRYFDTGLHYLPVGSKRAASDLL